MKQVPPSIRMELEGFMTLIHIIMEGDCQLVFKFSFLASNFSIKIMLNFFLMFGSPYFLISLVKIGHRCT